MNRDWFLKELESDILPFWYEKMKDPRGGWYGRMDGNGVLHPDAVKGCILNARILWTFSSAYRMLGNKEYLRAAERSYIEIRDRFIDKEYGGLFWSINADGTPNDCKKQFYAIAFGIYGVAEYHRATGDSEAASLAMGLFHCIEEHSYDGKGYIEAACQDWSQINDMRLSDKDQNDSKTMNTHLHILEAYTCLYRIDKSKEVHDALRKLISIFVTKIVRSNGHLGLFFGDNWESHSETISYGHDIEASWLLEEAAEVLGDTDIIEQCQTACERIARAAIEGFTPEGGMIYEYNPVTGHKDGDRHWWVQAETVVGCLYRYRETGDKYWLDAADSCTEFIDRQLLAADGEWYWSLKSDDTVNTDDDRAGFWKCPYHNGRMCMEVLSMSEC